MFTDLLVIVVYFLAIFCIGIYAGRRQNSLTDYALGNRSLPWWAILASILAAEISAATFLGAPGEGYHTRNFTYAQLCIGTILGRIIVGKLFLKPYYDYKVVSIYEYLEKRFGLLTRRTASMVFLVSRVLASGTRLYFAGILLVIAYQFMTDTTADANQIVLLYIAALVVISINLGIMNLLPIPPLDGGRFVVEIFQKGTRKTVSQKAMNYMSLAGMALFLGFFVIMLNQDIQRFVFGNWG